MIEVKFFGTARVKFQVRSIEVEASDVKELISVVAERFSIREKEVKQFLIYVNDVNIASLKMYKTKLKDGDKVMFLSPASGG